MKNDLQLQNCHPERSAQREVEGPAFCQGCHYSSSLVSSCLPPSREAGVDYIAQRSIRNTGSTHQGKPKFDEE
jgi:hypothetical protein